MLFSLFSNTALLFIYFVDHSNADCRVPIDVFMTGSVNYSTWPLVLYPTIPEFFILEPYPGEIFLHQSEDLRLACPGAGNQFADLNPPVNIITIICVDDQFFWYNNELRNFYESFSCANTPRSSEIIMAATGQTIRFQIGFQITDHEFVPLITIDYNRLLQHVMSTSHTIFRFTNHGQTSDRPNFLRGMHPVQDIDNFYSQNFVSNLMDVLIGVNNRQRYFRDQSYLARGHLAARTDFPFAAQQIATFYHLNCFPQFQAFNNLNWRALEESIRDHDFGSDVITYTSVEDIIHLPNANGHMTALHLMNGNQFPIPLSVNKIIVTNDYIYSFVGFNHPNIVSDEFDNLINENEDICDTPPYEWLKESLRIVANRRNPLRGKFLCVHFPMPQNDQDIEVD